MNQMCVLNAMSVSAIMFHPMPLQSSTSETNTFTEVGPNVICVHGYQDSGLLYYLTSKIKFVAKNIAHHKRQNHTLHF